MVLLIISFILIYCLVISLNAAEENGTSPRFTALCYAAVLWAVILYGMTELLSLWNGLTGTGVLVSWLIVCVFLAAAAAWNCRKRGYTFSFFLRKAFLRKAFGSYRLKTRLFAPMIPIGALSIYMIVMTVKTVPYNWDCLAYHLPRIYFWAQNGSVAHYATNDVRQLASPVFAEFVNLHVYLMSDLVKGAGAASGRSDVLFNLLQCFSYLFGGILVYHIADDLGCRRPWSYMAVILYLGTPILFAEAITPQVELVAMVWLLIFVYLWIDVAEGKAALVMGAPDSPELSNAADLEKSEMADAGIGSERKAKERRLKPSAGETLNGKNQKERSLAAWRPAFRFVMMGFCVGLGYETKPSVCVGQAIFVLILLIICMQRREKPGTVVLTILVALIPAVLIPMPEIARNLATFGSISNEQVGTRQLIGRRNPRYVLTNFVKNFCYNLPADILHGSGERVTAFVQWFADRMHVDLNDSSIAESGMAYAAADPADLGNDRAINPLPVWSMMVACAVSIVYAVMRTWQYKHAARRSAAHSGRHFGGEEVPAFRESNGGKSNRLTANNTKQPFHLFHGTRKHFLWGSVLSFLVMMALIRWEPYEVRYETAYLALLCPMIATVGDRVTAKRKYIMAAGAWIGVEIALSVFALINLLTYHTDIMVNRAGSRPDGYFVYLGGMEDNLKWMTEEIRDREWKEIGLYPMNSYPEYPILAMMDPYADRFGYVIYEPDHYANVSMYEYDDPDFRPDCIVWLHELPEGISEGEYSFHGVTYDRWIGEDGYYLLYSSQEKS